MTRLNFVLVGCLLFFSPKTLPAQTKKAHENPIVIGQIITLKSAVLNEQRQIYVSLPDGYDTLTSNLPVIYVLDAEYRFGIAQSIQSYFNITTRIPRAILIGIANPTKETRQRDYLPKAYGGEAEKFSKFLSEEVFEFVEQGYKASKKRYLAGHSHGGVFVVYTLLNKPDLFEGYIAIDPSLKHIYSDGDTLLNRELKDKRLYLASSDVAYGYLEDVAADMQADFAVFKNRLYQTREKNKLSFKIDHIDDDHGNSYIHGFSRGLRYVFNWRFE
jgi:predicted alpha/beta superfamily hydrolase